MAKAKAKPDAKKKAFRDRAAELLREDERVADLELHPTEFAIQVKLRDGEEPTIFLDNFYAESRDIDPDERDDFLRSRFETLFAHKEGDDDDWDSVAPLLLPTIRAVSFGMATMLLSKEAEPTQLRRPFAPYLSLHLAIDGERSIRYALASNLAAWGLREKEAFARSLANARRWSAPALYDDKNGPLYYVDVDDSYQSSRLAIPGLLASFADKVEGQPIAIVPERSQLYIAGDRRDVMVERLLEMAEKEYEASTRSISPALYTVDAKGNVVPYLRKKKDALAKRIHLAQVKLALRECGEQKEVLGKLHERDDVDIFVASLNGLLRKDGRAVTWAMWGEAIDSLLPVAELVMLTGEEDGGANKKKKKDDHWSFFAPWDVVASIMGKAWAVEPGMDPQRIRPKAWPDAAQMKKLRAAAVEPGDLP